MQSGVGRGASSPCLRGCTDLRRKQTSWDKRGAQEEARESWTPSSPAYKISVFISKGTCAEAVGEEKGDQGDWGEGARREPDSDSEMDVERGGLTPTHSATCTRTSTRSPTARASRSRKPSTTQQEQRESAPAGRDWASSDPPLTRQLTPGWEGVAQIPL